MAQLLIQKKRRENCAVQRQTWQYFVCETTHPMSTLSAPSGVTNIGGANV